MKKLGDLFVSLKTKLRRYDDTHNFTCDVCGREVFGGERVCTPCNRSLPYNLGSICPFCGRKVKEEGTCLDCKEKPLTVRFARSCFTHEGEAARLVSRFKKGEKYLYRTLADIAEPLLKSAFPQECAVTYVPMTERAEKRRGYNQSRLLVKELARRSGRELLEAVEKPKETPQQKSLGRREREKNLEGVFRVSDRKAVKGKSVIIIDDTLTTGATSSAVADALLKAGAKDTYLLTITSVEKKNVYGKPTSAV
ncbi:MAG: ComF family protein [Clostridiales bacterium]|nr:ComF family protein [Clostridiales bacterium]